MGFFLHWLSMKDNTITNYIMNTWVVLSFIHIDHFCLGLLFPEKNDCPESK